MAELRTIDVPQADSLPLIRRVVEAVAKAGNAPVKELSDLCGFSERHVRYRIAAARILVLLDDADCVTALGKRLLKSAVGSDAEKDAFRTAIDQSPTIQRIAPRLLHEPRVDVKALGQRISSLTGLSLATSERRAVVLRAWQRDLS